MFPHLISPLCRGHKSPHSAGCFCCVSQFTMLLSAQKRPSSLSNTQLQTSRKLIHRTTRCCVTPRESRGSFFVSTATGRHHGYFLSCAQMLWREAAKAHQVPPNWKFTPFDKQSYRFSSLPCIVLYPLKLLDLSPEDGLHIVTLSYYVTTINFQWSLEEPAAVSWINRFAHVTCPSPRPVLLHKSLLCMHCTKYPYCTRWKSL